MSTKDKKLVFLGTPDFAVPFLQALIDNSMKPVLVITQPDEPVGRKQEFKAPPVKVLAEKSGIEVKQPEGKSELSGILKKHQPDVCVLVAYGDIITKEALAIPKFGFVNIHPSLLPVYRGPSPVQAAILNQDRFTGVSIMLLDQKVDHGPILAQEKIEILPTDNNEILHRRLAEAGTKLLVKILPEHLAGKIKPQPQDDSKATFTEIIKRSDGQVNWSKPASEIEAQFRAYFPWPGVFSLWGEKRLKIANLSVLEDQINDDLAAGTVFLTQNKALAVKCGQGAVELKSVQLEGKKEMSGEDFARGYQNIVGVVLK